MASSPVPRGSGLGGSVGRELVTNEQTSRQRDADRATEIYNPGQAPLYRTTARRERAPELPARARPRRFPHGDFRFVQRSLLISAESCHFIRRARHNDATLIHQNYTGEKDR